MQNRHKNYTTNRKIQSMGGKAVAQKHAPPYCPKCGKPFAFATPWHSYLGHLGLHGLADNHFDGDIHAAQRRLRNNGLARQDPAPWNNAWPRYRPIIKETPMNPEQVYHTLYQIIARLDTELRCGRHLIDTTGQRLFHSMYIHLNINQLKIHPKNLRLHYPDEDVAEMGRSIKAAKGVLQALLITPVDGLMPKDKKEAEANDKSYYVIDGNMRLAGARTLGNTCPPLKCEILYGGQAEQLLAMAITTEFHYPKGPLAKARHYQRLKVEEGLSTEEIAAQSGVHPSSINNYLFLLNLDDEIQQLIAQDKLTADMFALRRLHKIPDKQRRIELAQRWAQRNYTGRQMRQGVTFVLKQLNRLENIDLPKQMQPKPDLKLVENKPVKDNYPPITAQKINQVATLHLCQGCTLTSLSQKCWTCDGPYQFMLHLGELVESRLPTEQEAAA